MGPADSACKSFNHGFRAVGDDGEIGARGAIGTATALFPILQGTRVEREAASKLGAAEAGGCPHGAHIYIERKRELMRGRGFRFALGDGGGFAHGFDEFAGYVLALHGLIVLASILVREGIMRRRHMIPMLDAFYFRVIEGLARPIPIKAEARLSASKNFNWHKARRGVERNGPPGADWGMCVDY